MPTGMEVVGKIEPKATKACIREGIAHQMQYPVRCKLVAIARY